MKTPPNKKIQELEKRIKRLEAEKDILNTAIDTADQTLNTNIRKKYLSLLLEGTSQQQAQQQGSSASGQQPTLWVTADSIFTSTAKNNKPKKKRSKAYWLWCRQNARYYLGWDAGKCTTRLAPS